MVGDLAPGDSNPVTPDPATVASDGVNFMATVSNSTRPLANIFDQAGKALHTVDIGPKARAATAFDGTNYLVVAATLNANGVDWTLAGHRITPLGVDLDGPMGNPYIVGGISLPPSIAVGANNSLAVYTKFDNTTYQHLLYGVLIDRNGQMSGPGEIPIAVDNSSHLFPSVAYDGTNYLVV